MSSMYIAFAGSVAYDYLMTFPGFFKDHILPEKLDRLSVSFLVDGLTRHRGGVAANIAYSYSLLGGKAILLAAVGGEDFSDYRAWLEKQKIDLSGVKVVEGVHSASFFANTDQSNAQIASFYPGAMAELERVALADLPQKPELVVVSPDEPDVMRSYVTQCQELGIPYIYDPGQQLIRLSKDDVWQGILNAKIVLVNEYEWEVAQKEFGLSKDKILNTGAVLCVTLGDKGSQLLVEDDVIDVPVIPAAVVADPTGAGDAFRGGFLRGLAADLDWKTCGRIGALAATYCVEHKGTQNHHYTLDQFVARYREHFNEPEALGILFE